MAAGRSRQWPIWRDLIGDYRAFAAQQRDRLLARGLDIRPYPLSHLAVRVPEWDQHVHLGIVVDDWVPQRLVTATGPIPMPR
jgi:hypothetical protein